MAANDIANRDPVQVTVVPEHKAPCPREPQGEFFRRFEYEGRPDDGTCDYCGSLLAGAFMDRLEAGDVVLVPTDKDYKVYVRNDGGALFRQSHRTDDARTADQSQWVWATREVSETKLYFEHLSEEQGRRFVELLNAGRLKLDFPGHFYRLPFFVRQER
jgi:hypothetical protein